MNSFSFWLNFTNYKSAWVSLLDVLECFMQSFVLSVVFVDSLNSFLLDIVSYYSTVHYFHQEGFKVVVGKSKVKVRLWVCHSFLENILGQPSPGLIAYLNLFSIKPIIFVVLYIVRLAFFRYQEHWRPLNIPSIVIIHLELL